MSRTTLLALASRVEAAAGADRELDCLIWAEQNGEQITWQGNCMVAGVHGVVGWIDPGVTQRNFSTNRATTGPASIPAYTASLDAARTLVPSGLILRNYQSSRFVPHSCEVALSWAHGGWLGNSDHSFALALTAACLRALAVLEQDNG